ncbi:hypothetical protein Tco_1468426 [Tanacetum coccineum]
MSSGSQTVGDAIIPKFDMHVYTSVLTLDEVKNLVAKYAIPLDLHPCVPPTSLTMNRLPVDKIGIYDQYLELSGVRGHWFSFERHSGKGGQDKIFNEFCTSLKHWKDRFFLIDCRTTLDAMPWRHQNSSVTDPPPTGVLVEDICRLCENIIDLRPVHPAMLYAIGLTTIWKHVGHHPVFKDSEGTVATSMSQFLKFLMVRGVRVDKGTALRANEVIPQHTIQSLPSSSQIPEKSAAEGTSRRTKKKKGAPLTFALDESEGDDSTRTSSETHHSTSPLNTIISDDVNPAAGRGSLVLESVRREDDDADHSLENVEDGNEANSPPIDHSLRPQHSYYSDEDAHVHFGGLHHDEEDEQDHMHASGSFGHVVSSFSGGSARLAFPKQNPGGDGAVMSDMMINLATPAVQAQQIHLSDHQALQLSWFALGRGALAQIDLLQWYEALNNDYGELYESHRSCQDVSNRLAKTQNQLVDVIQNRNQLADENKTLRQDHLGCAGKEAALAEKLAMVEKEKDDLLDKTGTLKGDLEHFTLDLSHAEIVRHNYVRHLLPTVFQQLLSSDECKKSLSDVFNQAIAAGWSKGVKVEHSVEDAEVILSTASDYDPECKATFMSAFDALFTKSYPYVEKVTKSFRLPLGDHQNMRPEGTEPTLSSNAVDVQ